MSDQQLVTARAIVRHLSRELGLSPHQGEIERAFHDLVSWVPESGFPMTEGVYGESREELESNPFMTEGYLYELLGKEDARTLLGLVRRIGELVGIDWSRRSVLRGYDAGEAVEECWKKFQAARNGEDEEEVHEAASNLKRALDSVMW